jgi:CheY-like chemotaxis protein/two-component sensor histidine kinase
VARQVEHMTRLVDDLLDVSRVTRGRVNLVLRYWDLRELITLAVEHVRPLMAPRAQTLSLDLGTQPVRVQADRTRLVQVFGNLLNNAVKYTQDGGHIAVDLAIKDGRARVTVRDNGSGIEAELLPQVFELFVQGERSRDRSQGGLGLGLALARQLVALHGGAIEASSAGKGQGSAFTVALPLARDAADTLPAQASAAALPAQRQQKLVIVDDNLDAARLLAATLRAHGHECMVFGDAESLLEQAPQADAFVLDLGLPGMDGFELARRLHASAQDAPPLLIALTGYDQPRDRAMARDAGFTHYLVKPVPVSELLARLPAAAVSR